MKKSIKKVPVIKVIDDSRIKGIVTRYSNRVAELNKLATALDKTKRELQELIGFGETRVGSFKLSKSKVKKTLIPEYWSPGMFGLRWFC